MERPRYDVFLSYNREDRKDVEQLAEELQSAGVEVFIDKSLEAGEVWINVLEQALATAAACAVCVGPNGLGERWHQFESNVAIERAVGPGDEFHVTSVLLPGSDMKSVRPLLRQWQFVDLREGVRDSPEFRKFVDKLKSQRPAGDPDPTVGKRSRRSVRTIPITHLSANLQNLRRFIRNRLFTPVLGSGCSLVGRSQCPAWATIAEEMEGLLAGLEDDDSASRYLRSLAALPAYDIPLFAHRPSLAPAEPPEVLTALQLALTRLGAVLNGLFASVMLESNTPVWDTMGFRLPIPSDHEKLQAVSQLLVEACIAAYRLREQSAGRDAETGLGSAGIYAHLVELAAEFADDQRLAGLKAPAERDAHPGIRGHLLGDITIARRDSHLWEERRIGTVLLAVYQLEWVADALWHTFRYNKAAYPRSDELAFQVSLLVDHATGRGAGLPTLAQAAEIDLSTDTIAAWFRHYSGSSAAKMLEFYDTLARILEIEFKSFREHAAGESEEALKPLWPVAFSTNYDLELEIALQRTRGISAFHVVVPVEAFRPDGGDPDLGWLFGTVGRFDEANKPEWEWFGSDRHLSPREVKGPILLKLHGSPLHHLPTLKQLMESDQHRPKSKYASFEHALVLTESQYMESIAWKDPVPDFFDLLLHQDRALFFLGHSVKEWSTRLRVFNHIYRRGAPAHNHPGRVAINRSHDPLRSALLSAIGIERWVGDLEEIPRAVAAMQ